MVKKTNHLHIRLTDSEYQQIQNKAREANITLSEFVRTAALRRQLPLSKIDRKMYEILSEIQIELNCIGSNLNQITKACNISTQLIVVEQKLLENTQHLTEKAIEALTNTQKAIIKAL